MGFPMKDNNISIFQGWKLTNNPFKNAHTKQIRSGCISVLLGDRDSAIRIKNGYFWRARDVKNKSQKITVDLNL